MTARHTTSAVAAVLAAALLVVVLVTWAASIGPSDVLRGDGIPATTDTPTAATTQATPLASPTPSDGERLEQRTSDGVSPIWRTIAFFIELLTLALALYLLWRMLRWAREAYDARDRRLPVPDDVDFEVISAPQATEQILEDAAVQLSLLDDGTPRNAIVASWHRFEVQALAAGFGRRHWETSSEFTLRFLDLVAADEHAVARFAELYREARFSDHEIDESARNSARTALAAIHDGLVAGANRRFR